MSTSRQRPRITKNVQHEVNARIARRESKKRSKNQHRQQQRQRVIADRRRDAHTAVVSKQRKMLAAMAWAKREREKWRIEKPTANSDYIAQLTAVAEQQGNITRSTVDHMELEENDSVVNVDVNAVAMEYSNAYEESTQFVSCGCCGVEDGKKVMKALDSVCRKKYDFTGLSKLYREQVLSINPADHYKARFAEAIEAEFTEEGVLKACCWICNNCLRTMERTKKQIEAYEERENGSNVSTVQPKLPRWEFYKPLPVPH